MKKTPGWATNAPEKLCPCIRRKLADLRQLAQAEGIPVAVVETMRDFARQRHYVKRGVSKTMRSKHLPQKPGSLSLAFDVCPREYLSLPGWNPEGSAWATLGRIGRGLGLTWGGDWRTIVDRPHFELRACECALEEEPAA